MYTFYLREKTIVLEAVVFASVIETENSRVPIISNPKLEIKLCL